MSTQRSRMAREPFASAAPLVLALLISLTVGAGCSKKERPAPLAVPIRAATVVTKDVPLTVKTIGAVEACTSVNVTALVGGQLTRVSFQEGDDVSKGSLLFTIDPRPYQAALQQAISDSVRDQAASVLADANEARYADLVQKDYVTRQDYDAARAQADAARATLQADSAICRTARLNLSYCWVRSPLTGRTGDLLIDEGNLVRANDTTPLVVIRQIKPVFVSFSVPAQYLPDIRRHSAAVPLTVNADSPSDSVDVAAGELTFIDNAVDQTTGTILLKATFANEDELFWPGEFVDVSLVLEILHDAVVAPSAAIQQGQNGPYVFLISPDLTVKMQPVAVGEARDGEVVVTEGLQPNDRVVTDGQLRLTPGAKVEIKPATAPGAKMETRPGS